MTESDFIEMARQLNSELSMSLRQEHSAIIRRYLERAYKAGNESKQKAFPDYKNHASANPESVSTNWEPVIDQCERILILLEQLPERAEDFGESVRDRVEGIRETILDKDYVTANQKLALDNMEEAVQKWIH